MNPKFTELTGYTSEETIGQNPRILNSGELPDKIYKELWDKISSGKEWRGEFHNKKKNGEYFWEAVSISPIFDKQGKITNYIKVAEDITERKRAEEALRESEEKYRTIFESSPEAIVLFDKKGNVIDINDRIEDWLGYKPEDITRKNLAVFPFLSNRSKALALKKISQRMSGKEIPPFELEFTDKNGEIRIGLITASIIKDEKGKIIQNLVMISDITERKKVEEELAKHREHLEELGF
ncbi:unnamed protein product [marine sediment metagenome]|uniref:histidine kinase n=1 Tax=marine sediment metagenome TaxID=412755 RepID=X1EYQ9_9ZZZZ